MTTKYNDWTKSQLIEHILKLEGHQNSDVVASRPQKKVKEMDFSKYSTRKIAIRFAYLGWNYNGLAVQNDPSVKTVEGCILEAFNKTKVIPSLNPSDCEFSRCGRTDTGVSAMRQVISLRVRSNLNESEQVSAENDEREIDYLKMLNSLLPNDIVAYQICLRPPAGFDARFSCLSRHYHYYFYAGRLNIDKMRAGAALFEGKHDFRNFCKVDGSKQITNFVRDIVHSRISATPHPDLFYFDLKGTAFLWHQVRSMMSILLVIGQEIEPPELVSQLLDVDNTPRRPVYPMAADYPLVLYDCEFPSNVEWLPCRTIQAKQQLTVDMFNMWHRRKIEGSLIDLLQSTLQNYTEFSVNDIPLNNPIRANLGDGIGKPTSNYKPIMTRERLATPDEVNKKWKAKKTT